MLHWQNNNYEQKEAERQRKEIGSRIQGGCRNNQEQTAEQPKTNKKIGENHENP